jgi:hypothetical protein
MENGLLGRICAFNGNNFPQNKGTVAHFARQK